MPHFRGIEISIHASLEAKQITEYPHPEGSSVRLLRATTIPVNNGTHSGTGRPSQTIVSPPLDGTDPTRLKKVNPRISVYIPSLPGEQFWIRYLVTQSPPPSRCMFFKMAMNGRHISSWGINTNTRSAGIVVRALYKPDHKWEEAGGNNAAGYPGIETRYFHFMPGLDNKSVAEDGGVIEVQAFRCKGRKRVALELDSYRNQERYGITSPSGGLVDNPEDATYYNYYLIDAKDAPYATFCFHYRSMKYLKQLNLIPQPGLDASPASKRSFDLQRERSAVPLSSGSNSPPPRRFTFGSSPLESRIFDDDVSFTSSLEVGHVKSNPREEYSLKSPPEFSPPSLNEPSEVNTEALEMELSNQTQQRPLPEVPTVQTRPASASSLCPSLTPSLKQYVESEDFENEEIRLSTAQPMLITSESMQALELVNAGVEEGTSFSDYASSPTSTEASHSPELPSPAGYIPTTGSVLERQLTQFDSLHLRSSPPKTGDVLCSTTDITSLNNQIEHRARVLSLTEAEWLRHTPSPLARKDRRSECLWSPCPESGKEDKMSSSDDDVQSMRLYSHSSPDQAPIGNWI
ncbi:hypothetical protein F5B22DRAFT_656043 [Xylaria bambusicola]|uniref:uncharacterized protein n=1 Tax=Xylaria bambusicola TaxID=326684 RepID=UPI002008869C|nr:uncharacterized protein F5B22DRAFT_656043 [Xylaria bambusicola]KAI0515348.1 hypothetical protein F5B22DRAFT_656043 [Xylaria bambusicola]